MESLSAFAFSIVFALAMSSEYEVFQVPAHECNELEAMVNEERRRSGLSTDLACDGHLRFVAAQHAYDAKKHEAEGGGSSYHTLGKHVGTFYSLSLGTVGWNKKSPSVQSWSEILALHHVSSWWYPSKEAKPVEPLPITLNSVTGPGCDLHSWALKFPCCFNSEKSPSCMWDKLREFSRDMGPKPIDKVGGKSFWKYPLISTESCDNSDRGGVSNVWPLVGIFSSVPLPRVWYCYNLFNQPMMHLKIVFLKFKQIGQSIARSW